MKNIRIFVSENFQFLEVKVSIYLNRRVFVMLRSGKGSSIRDMTNLVDFSPCFTMETFVTYFQFEQHMKTLLKGSTLNK